MLLLGFDEAGRGPLAGPVCAAAVILPADFPIEILNDSKKLSEKKRAAAEIVIKEKAYWGIALVDHKKIDEINILEASMLAMKLAFENMLKKADENWDKNSDIKWNFTKFIIDRNGNVVARFEPTDSFELIENCVESLME